MSLATRASIRRLIDSRPPVLETPAVLLPAVSPDQLPLDLWPDEPVAAVRAPRVRRRCLRTAWTVARRPDLPDALGWGSTLAPAVLQAMLAQRPAAQLNRWLAEPVMAEVNRRQRQSFAAAERSTREIRLSTLRVAHPQPEAAEGAAVLMVGRRPVAAAFRLEACAQRWLCTAYELGRAVG